MLRKRILLGIFFFLIVLSLGWQLGIQMERERSATEQALLEARFSEAGSGVTFDTDPEEEVDLSLMWTVWRLLDQFYVEPGELTIDEMRYGAVEGLVRAIGDPYTAFMTPKESSDFHQSLQGTLEGIGAELTVREGAIVVVAPLKGSPAVEAGLQPHDVITAVDGEELNGASLQDAVMRIRGPKGTEVVLTVFRPALGEKIDIGIVRDTIKVPSVEYEVLETGSGSVGYIGINQFGAETIRDARKAVRALADQELPGLILDLRFNGGGYLDGAVELASFFLTQGKIVSVHRRGEEIEAQFARGDVLMPELPMVVLINEGSASASEIVAGALQDHGRAVIIGAKSFGKGTVQEVVDLPGGSSLRVTVAKWKTPSGRDLSQEGIEPDLAVERTMEDVIAEIDPQKDKAAEHLLDQDVFPDENIAISE